MDVQDSPASETGSVDMLEVSPEPEVEFGVEFGLPPGFFGIDLDLDVTRLDEAAAVLGAYADADALAQWRDGVAMLSLVIAAANADHALHLAIGIHPDGADSVATSTLLLSRLDVGLPGPEGVLTVVERLLSGADPDGEASEVEVSAGPALLFESVLVYPALEGINPAVVAADGSIRMHQFKVVIPRPSSGDAVLLVLATPFVELCDEYRHIAMAVASTIAFVPVGQVDSDPAPTPSALPDSTSRIQNVLG
jgi:hypothetical protein